MVRTTPDSVRRQNCRTEHVFFPLQMLVFLPSDRSQLTAANLWSLPIPRDTCPWVLPTSRACQSPTITYRRLAVLSGRCWWVIVGSWSRQVSSEFWRSAGLNFKCQTVSVRLWRLVGLSGRCWGVSGGLQRLVALNDQWGTALFYSLPPWVGGVCVWPVGEEFKTKFSAEGSKITVFVQVGKWAKFSTMTEEVRTWMPITNPYR